MSIYKQDNCDIWFVDFSIRGRRIRRSTGTTSKQAAQEYHDRLKAELWKQTKLGDKPDRTWDEAVARYVQEKADKRSIEHDKLMLRWSAPHLKGLKLHEITTEVIEDLIAKRRAGKAKRTNAGVSNATVNRHIDAVMRVLNLAVIWGWLPAAPKKRKLKESRSRLRWLTKEEIERLLAAVAPHKADLIRFARATGLREQKIESNRYDDAMLRLSCAEGMATILNIALEGEGDTPSNQVVSPAIYGISTLIEDAQRSLSS